MAKQNVNSDHGKKKLSSAQYQRIRRKMKKIEKARENKRRSREKLKAINQQKLLQEAAEKK